MLSFELRPVRRGTGRELPGEDRKENQSRHRQGWAKWFRDPEDGQRARKISLEVPPLVV